MSSVRFRKRILFGLPIPAAPTLTAPASVTDDTTPTFTWGAVSGASTYDLQVDDNSDFASPIIDETGIATNSYTPGDALATFTTLYARVRGVNAGGGVGAWSSTLTFTVKVFVLLDEFGGALAAGSVNGTNASDGINARTVVDTTSKLAVSVANGAEFTGSGAANGNPGLWYPTMARAGGLTVALRVKPVSGAIAHRVGFDSDQVGDLRDGIYFGSGTLRAYFIGNQRSLLTYTANVTYDCLVVTRPTAGIYIYIRGGAFTDWTLMYVDINSNAANLFASAVTNAAASTGTFYVGKVSAAVLSQLAGQYAGVTERKAVSVNGDTITAASGNGIIEHTITAATGVTQELMVRRTDDNNCVIIRMDQGAGTINVYEKNAGTETELTGGTTTQTWTNGQQYRIQVLLFGTTIRVTVDLAGKNDSTGTGFNANVTGVKVSRAGADLIAWPINPTGGIKSQMDIFFPAA